MNRPTNPRSSLATRARAPPPGTPVSATGVLPPKTGPPARPTALTPQGQPNPSAPMGFLNPAWGGDSLSPQFPAHQAGDKLSPPRKAELDAALSIAAVSPLHLDTGAPFCHHTAVISGTQNSLAWGTLRPRGRAGIGRALYCFLVGKRVIVLHAFIKKTPQIPDRELKLARKRMREVSRD